MPNIYPEKIADNQA